MAVSKADENLLLGVLALRMEFITREQLLAGAQAWASDKSQSLGRILLRLGAMDSDTLALLETLAHGHLQIHGNDPKKSLAAVSQITSICDDLKQLGDGEIDATLAHASGTRKEQEIATTTSYDSPATPGRRFLILRPHAKGGLGQVSVAFDEELGREVALKELLVQHAGDPDRRCQFLLEARITGWLEHPGIVPVYGLGEYADGRPFYAMRFVRGKSLKDAIQEFHKADGPGKDPGERVLELRKLLGRVLDACNAIQYAHSRGVLHRDLKPANIMLADYGETLVVDWGLARVMKPTEPVDAGRKAMYGPPPAGLATDTQMGKAKGTPAYMSPEQAAGRTDQVGPASDVYGLGTTLYCLLTGQAPFQEKDVFALLENVRNGNFPRPRDVKPQVPPPLESICLKAMALKPEDRYQSPEALAEDIEHWLADEPVSAHRETVGQRAGRWMRHHRSWTQAGAAALLLVAAILLAATLLVNRARREAITLADHNRVLAEKESIARQDALLRLKEARHAVDFWTTGAGEVLKYHPRAQWASQRLFEKAAEDYERFAQQESDDAGLEIERGRAYLRLGDVRKLLDKLAEAEQAYRSAESLFSAISLSRPELLDAPLELANTRSRLGLLLVATGRRREADQAYQLAVAALQPLAELHPEDPRFLDALGTSLFNRGVLLKDIGPRKTAETTLRQSLAEFEHLLQVRPNEPRYRLEASTARSTLGKVLMDEGLYEKAGDQFRQAISCLEDLVENDPDNPDYLDHLASARMDQTTVLRALGQYAKEMEAYLAAAADYELLATRMPDVPAFAEQVALSWGNLGLLLHEVLGRSAEAKVALERALRVFAKLKEDNAEVPRYKEELATYRQALGRVLAELGRNEEAKAALAAAMKGYQDLVASSPEVPRHQEQHAIASSHFAQVLHRLGEHAEADAEYRAAIKGLEELSRREPDKPAYRNELAFVCEHLGDLLRETDKAAEAKEVLGRARELRFDLVAKSRTPEYLHNLAWLLVNCVDPQLRDPAQAVEFALEAKERTPQNAAYHSTLGAAHYRAGDWKSAKVAIDDALRRRPQGHARDWFFLAMAQKQLGQADEAATNYRLGCRWLQENCPQNRELVRIQCEAAELLGLAKSDSPPKDVPPKEKE